MIKLDLNSVQVYVQENKNLYYLWLYSGIDFMTHIIILNLIPAYKKYDSILMVFF